MVHRPTMIRDQDTIEIRLTREAEYRLPFTFIEALNEGPLFDRPAHVFRDAARQHRLFHVANRTTENILGTGVVQPSSVGDTSRTQAEVGGLMVHPAARGFGLASLLLKVMMVYAVKESGRDSPDEQYLAHVADGPAGHGDVHRGEVDAVIDHMLMGGRPGFGCRPSCSIVKRWETWFRPFGNSCARTAACSPDPTEQVILGRRLISRT